MELLKSRGLTSPYLRRFVVARITPIRFRPKEAEPLSFNETLERMNKALAKFNPEKIKIEDLARTGGWRRMGNDVITIRITAAFYCKSSGLTLVFAFVKKILGLYSVLNYSIL